MLFRTLPGPARPAADPTDELLEVFTLTRIGHEAVRRQHKCIFERKALSLNG